eukprot:SAG31_NODE_346_length_17349_cov_9.825875_12_plen_240_part_00
MNSAPLSLPSRNVAAAPQTRVSKDILIFLKYAGIPGERGSRDFVLFVVSTNTHPVSPSRLFRLCAGDNEINKNNAKYAHEVCFGTTVYTIILNILTSVFGITSSMNSAPLSLPSRNVAAAPQTRVSKDSIPALPRGARGGQHRFIKYSYLFQIRTLLPRLAHCSSARPELQSGSIARARPTNTLYCFYATIEWPSLAWLKHKYSDPAPKHRIHTHGLGSLTFVVLRLCWQRGIRGCSLK